MDAEAVAQQMQALELQLKELQTQLQDKKRGAQGGTELVKVVYPPRDRKIKKFSGDIKEDLYLLEDFLQEVESVLSSTGREPAEHADFIISNLEGPAREEIKCLSREDQTKPELIKDALREVFGEKSGQAHLMSLLYMRRQESQESLQQYSLALLLLAHRVANQKGDAEGVLRDIFAENVADASLRRELKRHLRDKPEVTFRELRQYALKWEQDGNCQTKTKAKVSSQEAQATPNREQNDVLATLAKQQEAIDKLTAGMQELLKEGGNKRKKKPLRNEDGELVCYHCHQPGHIRPNCPKKKAAAEKAATAKQSREGSSPTKKSEN